MRSRASTLVIGAGIAGLSAARALADRGRSVVVIEKSRGVGGRMATRRVADGFFDHGAQRFRARGASFRRTVEEWLAAGAAREWAADRFPSESGAGASEPGPVYRGSRGMNSGPKHMASSLDVKKEARVISARIVEGQWLVVTDPAGAYRAESLVLTPPVPQSLAILDAGQHPVPERVRAALEAVEYEPCIAVLALLDGESRVPAPGGLELDGEPLAFIADNRKKGVSPKATAVTIHLGPGTSRAFLDRSDAEIVSMALDAASRWVDSVVVAVRVHRWRYARPLLRHAGPFAEIPGAAPALIAGDAFSGDGGASLVEEAALSGTAAAERLIALPGEAISA